MLGNSPYDNLDLTDNTVQEGGPVLRPGVYMATCTEDKFEQIGSTGNYKITTVFTDDDGHGQITHVFNVKHTNADAQRISRDQLKTFLTFGGHANPDKPSAAPMTGLKAKIVVEKEGTYKDRNGIERDSNKIKRFLRLDSPVQLGVAQASQAPAASGGGSSIRDDDIPF